MKKKVWQLGALAGLILLPFMIASTVLCYRNPNFEGSMILMYAGMLLAFSTVFVGIKTHRDQFNNGTITFLQALKTGGAIMFIVSTIYVIVWLLEYYLYMPDFLERYTAHVLAQTKTDGTTATELQSMTEQMAFSKKMYQTPFGVILLTYIEILPPGIVVTLISALILRRKATNLAPATNIG